jgi:hypothetical protein
MVPGFAKAGEQEPAWALVAGAPDDMVLAHADDKPRAMMRIDLMG